MERGNQGEQTQGDRSIPQGVEVRPTKPASGTDTVCVACKVPNGLIFNLYKMVPFEEPAAGGTWRTVQRADPTGEQVVLRGPAKDLLAMRKGHDPEDAFAGGFALNPGIPREHWEKVLKDYRDHPAIVSGLVFATKDVSSGMDEARNRRGLESGFEGIDPANPGKRTGLPITQAERPNAAA